MKFTIITPSFNHASYIRRTIESVITQRGDFEIQYVVMDGGSTDQTPHILQEYASKLESFPHITFTWISEPDNGQADAINKGLSLATGDIIAYLNSDDIYADGAFSAVQEFFQSHPEIGFVYGKCRIINEQDREIRKFIKYYRTWLGKKYSYPKLLAENFIPQPATFWRSTASKRVGQFNVDQHLCLDYEYWCRMGKHHQGAFLDAELASFRWYPNSKSGALFRDQFLDELAIARRYANGKHRLRIALHTFNVWKITTAYRIMQSLRV